VGPSPSHGPAGLTFGGYLEFHGPDRRGVTRRSAPTASPYTIRNESYNGVLGADASTSFGFLATAGGANAAPTVACGRTP
jgi:hypothetical protein